MAIYPPSRFEQGVTTMAQFIYECARGDDRIIRLDRSLRHTTGQVVVPQTKTVVPGRHKIYQEGDGTIRWYGGLRADRQQVFSGFTRGQIKGTFGGAPVLPEWWGLTAGEHDVAINCAIGASPVAEVAASIEVSLAPGIYNLAAPLDLTDSYAGLRGAGMRRTFLVLGDDWTPPDWYAAPNWDAVAGGNHAGAIYIGGTNGTGGSSFGTSVRGLAIECSRAAIAHWDKQVSGITHRQGWVEEGSIIDDVSIEYASGCCVGFPQHDGFLATVNGLRVSNFWFTGPMKRGTIPVLVTQHATNAHFENGTIAMGPGKAITSAYAEAGGGDPTIYPAPTYPFRTWPLIAIQAGGCATYFNIHVEGAGIALWLPQSSGIQNVIAENIKGLELSDLGQIYSADGRHRTTAAPSNTDYWNYSTGILISRESPLSFEPGVNGKDSFRGSFTSLGSVTYLLRDAAHSQEISAYGHGQYPLLDNAALSDYARGNYYTPNNFRTPIL